MTPETLTARTYIAKHICASELNADCFLQNDFGSFDRVNFALTNAVKNKTTVQACLGERAVTLCADAQVFALVEATESTVKDDTIRMLRATLATLCNRVESQTWRLRLEVHPAHPDHLSKASAATNLDRQTQDAREVLANCAHIGGEENSA